MWLSADPCGSALRCAVGCHCDCALIGEKYKGMGATLVPGICLAQSRGVLRIRCALNP